jgi:hypothetical protein
VAIRIVNFKDLPNKSMGFMRDGNTMNSNFKLIIGMILFCSLMPQYSYALDEHCSTQYKWLGDMHLPFLYKLDGNLHEPNLSKTKRIKHLIKVLESYDNTEEVRRNAFSELFTDHNYFRFKLKESTQKFINYVESYSTNENLTEFVEAVYLLRKELHEEGQSIVAFSVIESLERINELLNNYKDFKEEAYEAMGELESLGHDLEILEELSMSHYDFYTGITSISISLRAIQSCHTTQLTLILSGMDKY